ncbi:hypothetical protein CDAR_535281 [Caerostris darwini]|uniref:Uncharacterized protein n=1 Tax=Caerostris darwini TaxID=1538125 RepID=A0AAV4QLX1_9ARAC|nr:hypothetical protein CDAR_535281 [Caerostris darwini]
MKRIVFPTSSDRLIRERGVSPKPLFTSRGDRTRRTLTSRRRKIFGFCIPRCSSTRCKRSRGVTWGQVRMFGELEGICSVGKRKRFASCVFVYKIRRLNSLEAEDVLEEDAHVLS